MLVLSVAEICALSVDSINLERVVHVSYYVLDVVAGFALSYSTNQCHVCVVREGRGVNVRDDKHRAREPRSVPESLESPK